MPWLLVTEVQDTLSIDINLHTEDMEGIDTGTENDHESTSGSDTTTGFGGWKADGHPNELIPSNQAKLTTLMREINDLYQCVEAGESQPAEGLDCIEWELQNLSCTPGTTCLNPNTYWTLWRGNTSVHWHIVYHTETNKPN